MNSYGKYKVILCKCGHSKKYHVIDKYGRAYECKKCSCSIFITQGDK